MPAIGQTANQARVAVSRAAAALECPITTVGRMVQPFQTMNNVGMMVDNFQAANAAIAAGDHEQAGRIMARSAGMIPGTLGGLRETARMAWAGRTLSPTAVWNHLRACFAAGTPILWEHGVKNVEDFQVGDKVWARDENDPNGPVELKEIEECFDRTGRIFHLHVNGQVIRTTDEHPFFVVDKGWLKTVELQPGDWLVGHDGVMTQVEEDFDTGTYETVYNFRVADHHTYFVGAEDWGFSVWAHNACVSPIPRRDNNWNERRPNPNRDVRIFGRAQNTTGSPTDPHMTHINAVADQLAANAPEGSYVGLNRSWRTLLGPDNVIEGNVGQNLRADIVLVEARGNGRFRVHAFEVISPPQSVDSLNQRLASGWASVNKSDGEIQGGVFRSLRIGQFPRRR